VLLEVRLAFNLNIFNLFGQAFSVVKNEPEIWINYSAGINHKFNLARSRTPRHLVGFLPRMAIFLRWLVKRIRFSNKRSTSRDSAVFVFAETLNQWTSLKSSVAGFNDLSLGYDLYIDVSLLSVMDGGANKESNISSFGFAELVVGFALMVIRLPGLIAELRQKDRELVGKRLNGFLTIYFWIPFFFVALRRLKPKIILCSNDHNSANRSLLAVANYLKIPTAYVQHASVSSRFHKLEFNYSFLDGKHAYDAYLECENNTHDAPDNNNRKRWVFLSGVKRPLTLTSIKGGDNDMVGIAFKEADGISEVLQLSQYIVQTGRCVLLRYHPATSQSAINALNKFAKESGASVTLNSPYACPVNEYLGLIDTVVASNSTMLLEAAMVNVKSIYYEFRPAVTPDYYGYVEKNIAFQAGSPEAVVELINGELYQTDSRIEAIQQYSHTYNTIWHNREGSLVASHLKDILDGKSPEALWSSMRF